MQERFTALMFAENHMVLSMLTAKLFALSMMEKTWRGQVFHGRKSSLHLKLNLDKMVSPPECQKFGRGS
jgi:hypothetical protein